MEQIVNAQKEIEQKFRELRAAMMPLAPELTPVNSFDQHTPTEQNWLGSNVATGPQTQPHPTNSSFLGENLQPYCNTVQPVPMSAIVERHSWPAPTSHEWLDMSIKMNVDTDAGALSGDVLRNLWPASASNIQNTSTMQTTFDTRTPMSVDNGMDIADDVQMHTDHAYTTPVSTGSNVRGADNSNTRSFHGQPPPMSETPSSSQLYTRISLNETPQASTPMSIINSDVPCELDMHTRHSSPAPKRMDDGSGTTANHHHQGFAQSGNKDFHAAPHDDATMDWNLDFSRRQFESADWSSHLAEPNNNSCSIVSTVNGGTAIDDGMDTLYGVGSESEDWDSLFGEDTRG